MTRTLVTLAATASPLDLLELPLDSRLGPAIRNCKSLLFRSTSGRSSKLSAMNTKTSCKWWVSALVVSMACLPGISSASVRMDGVVSYDYYVAGVTPDGYELTDAEFYVERVVNDGSARSGPLSLSGWLTRDPAATGSGTEAGYLPIGTLPGNSTLEIFDTAPAEDAAPGEYYVHALLQDDSFPGSFEDSRSLPPRLLWRGGLEAKGPLNLNVYGGRLNVGFSQLHNNRLDSRYTNDIVLTLYATYGFGPASDGVTLCAVTVPGIYAGDVSYNAGFDCYPNSVPDGEYSLHLEVAEANGRGGSSTLTGPDAYFRGGRLDQVYGSSNCCYYDEVEVHYSGAMGLWGLLPVLMLGALRTRKTARTCVVKV